MKRTFLLSIAVCLCANGIASADTFGSGANQFDIDFVTISGDASSANGTSISRALPGQDGYKTFSDPGNDFRMGTYEITNDQWTKFTNNLGVPVTGSDLNAYDDNPRFTGTNMPTNMVSWYEAAQFVNWLNTSTGHQAAYKFTGTQGTGDYTPDIWNTTEAAGGTNLYRHKDAFYFIPTEDEWVKTAYWNGTSLQTYATKAGESLTQGDGTSGTGWNYYDNGYVTDPRGPWDVGTGSEELNGTFDMMGNVGEWTEGSYDSEEYLPDSIRAVRGGWYESNAVFSYGYLTLINRDQDYISYRVSDGTGFRVASVPEPTSVLLFGLGTLALRKRQR